MFYSIASDVCDYECLHSGSSKEASITVVWDLAGKYAALFSTSLPMAILGLTDYQPNQAQDESVRWTIKCLFMVLPFVCMFWCTVSICKFPLERTKHLKVLECIESHKAGKTVIDPITGHEVPPPEENLDETSKVLDYFRLAELEEVVHFMEHSEQESSLRHCLPAEETPLSGVASGIVQAGPTQGMEEGSPEKEKLKRGVGAIVLRAWYSSVAYICTNSFLLVCLVYLLVNPAWHKDKRSTIGAMTLICIMSFLVCLTGYELTRYSYMSLPSFLNRIPAKMTVERHIEHVKRRIE